MTYVVAGGGFSGVECIAEMNDFLREAVGAYHNIAERDLRLILLQRGERILPEVTASLAAFAHKLLVKRGIAIRLGACLEAVTANAVVVEDKQTRQTETIGTRTAVATVPAGPHPILTALPLPQGKGRIVLDQTTEVSDWPGVWAIGDCAAIKQVDGNISPPTAQHALRQAKTCAENMCHRAHFWLANCKIMNTTEIRHQKPRVLTFKDHWPPKSVIVVGQKSKWNSPFRCPKDGSPEEVLEKYRRHLVTAKLLRHLHELRGKNLVCCCSEKSRAPAMLSFCLRWLIANGFLANVRRKRVSSAREDET